ncbi:MAG: mobile mystery protein B [Verrucomicrobiota bacterium]
MTDKITDQPDGATPLDDISGLLRDEITTRKQLNAAETLNILSAEDWIEGGRLGDLFTVEFYEKLHKRMYDQVWQWAGTLRSETGVRPNIGVAPEMVPMELGRVAMNYNEKWKTYDQENLIPFIASYHHAMVRVHPFNNGNGRWSRLVCDVVLKRLTEVKPINWASDTLNVNSDERKQYIAALKRADDFDYQPLIDYLKKLNP